MYNNIMYNTHPHPCMNIYITLATLGLCEQTKAMQYTVHNPYVLVGRTMQLLTTGICCQNTTHTHTHVRPKRITYTHTFIWLNGRKKTTLENLEVSALDGW